MTEQAIVTRRLSPEAAELLRAGIDRQVESARKDFTLKLSQFHTLFDKSSWTDWDDSSTPRQPYRQVELVFRCVEEIVNAIQGLSLVLSTADEKVIESGPQYEILFNNPLMSFEKFIIQTVGHYALSRDVFWVFTDFDGSRPKEIAVVSGTQMHAITHNRRSDGNLIGWEFRGTGGQLSNYTQDEVYQIKNFNPYDRFHGVGPTSAGKLSINYSYAASLFNTSTLDNAAELGLILTTPSGVKKEEADFLRENFDARHRGAAKAKRTAILTGGMDVKTVALKMTDMQLAEISEMKDKRICSTFGVPPEIVGLGTEAQYAQGPAQKAFIFNTIMPLGDLVAGEITRGILSRFYSSDARSVELSQTKYYGGIRTKPLASRRIYRNARCKAAAAKQETFAWFDYDQHPVVQEHQKETAEKVFKFTTAGVTLNNLIEVHDLPYEQTPWGDYWWIGMGQVPASYALEAGIEGITGPSLPEGQEEGKAQVEQSTKSVIKADEQQRLRIWRNWVISWAGIEREYREAMRVFFVRQQRILIGKLKNALQSDKAAKADAEQIITRVVFDLKAENGKIKVINQAFFEKAGELGARQSISEVLGISGEALDEAAEQAKRMQFVKASLIRSSHKITRVNRFTQDMVARQLREGLEADEGLVELAARIKKALGWNRKRALTIARTQTAGAVGTGRHAGMKTAGVELRSWLSARDKDVRDSHRKAEQRYAEGIALDVPFQVGGELLMYPADPAGSAANIINCRCVEIAIRAAGKTFDLTYYSNLKFYSYSDMQNLSTETEQENEDK
jgi:HK97 family phage portal protein